MYTDIRITPWVVLKVKRFKCFYLFWIIVIHQVSVYLRKGPLLSTSEVTLQLCITRYTPERDNHT